MNPGKEQVTELKIVLSLIERKMLNVQEGKRKKVPFDDELLALLKRLIQQNDVVRNVYKEVKRIQL